MDEVGLLIVVAIVSLFVVMLPGAALGMAMRLRGIALLALAGPLSIALIGTTGAAAAVLGVPFGPLPVVGLTLLSVLLSVLVQRTPLRWEPIGRWNAATVVVGGCAAVATVVLGIIAFGSVGSAQSISQTYDGVFHLNAVASILDTGDASSFHLYRLTHPGNGLEFYPGGWHAATALTAQLTGASVPLAANAGWLTMNGTISALGAAYLAQVVIGSRGSARLAAPVAALVSTTGAAAPYVLLQWGVLYPTGLAYALLPAGLALAVVLLRRMRTGAMLPLIVLAALWLVAAAFAHPRSLVSFAVLVVPLIVAEALRAAARGLRRPAARKKTLIAIGATAIAVVVGAAAASFVVLRYFGADARPVSDRLNGGPATARQSVGESVLQVLALAPPSGPNESTVSAAPILAAIVAVGLVLALLRPRTRWVVAGYLIVGVLYVLSAGSNDDFAKIATGFWYKDKYRLFAVLGVLGPLLVALVAQYVTAAVTRRAPSRADLATATGAAVAVLVAITSWAGPTLADMRTSIGTAFALQEQKDDGLLDRAEVDVLTALPSLVPEGEVIVGSPWNGSALSWALGGREPLFPHFIGQWDADRVLIATGFDQIYNDPAVCQALDRLDATHLLVSDGFFWNGSDPQASFYTGIDRVDTNAGGFELVAEEGGTRLYRITACD